MKMLQYEAGATSGVEDGIAGWKVSYEPAHCGRVNIVPELKPEMPVLVFEERGVPAGVKAGVVTNAHLVSGE